VLYLISRTNSRFLEIGAIHPNGRWIAGIRAMQFLSQPQWYVSGQACALCDQERHLAHIVRANDKWFAYDATHADREGSGFLLLGSFVRRLTAMEAAQAETLRTESEIPEAPNPDLVRELTIGMLAGAGQELGDSRRRQHNSHQ
jgi:hypothetical protein